MREESATPDLEKASRHILEAVSRRDVDGALAAYGPDAVWDMSSGGLGVFEGRERIRTFFEDWLNAFEDYEQVMEEFRDLGNGVTLVVVLQRGRPTGSSGFVELRYAGVTTWVDGFVDRVILYTGIDEARAAAERLAQERG